MTYMGWATVVLKMRMDDLAGEQITASVLTAMGEYVRDALGARYVLCHVHDMILHCDVFPHSAKAFRMTRKLNMVVA